MTVPIACYSRKRKAWVVYDRPSRREALVHATATTETSGCLPMAWAARDGSHPTKGAAEAASARPMLTAA